MSKLSENEKNLIHAIEQCENEKDLKDLISSGELATISSDKLHQAITQNDNLLKNILLECTNCIIKLFSSTKSISEEFQKSKKSIDTLASQMLM
jgi:hypothetical protein